jgi:voltage-gated potassium channel
MEKLRKRIYEIIDVVPHAEGTNQKFDFFDVFLITLIILNVVAVFLETVQSLYVRYSSVFHAFDVFSVAVFTIEYLLRIWTCTLNPNYQRPVLGRIKFILTPLALIDLFAFLPFYLPLLLPFDLRFLRTFRLVRILRVLKIGRYSESLRLFGRVLNSRKAELLTSVFVIFILLIVSSSFLYQCEHKAQPEKFMNIIEALWWGVVTLTTVGYGDIYPITPLGKIAAGIISILGIGLFALPAGILSAGFIEEMRKKKATPKTCPHCGANLND